MATSCRFESGHRHQKNTMVLIQNHRVFLYWLILTQQFDTIYSTNLNLTKKCDYMKNGSPKKNSIISWIILGTGALLAVIGAMTVQEYRINSLVITGGAIVVVGIVYHLVMVRCPYCGHSLAGYRPLPDQCPECHKRFER